MLRRVLCWSLALGMAALLLGGPFVYFRWNYNHAKRLRVVTPGVLYRSGQMTAEGLTEAIQRYGIRTVINFQNEDSDPILGTGLRESTLCRSLGVRYHFLPPDLIDPRRVPEDRPEAIDQFLAIMDDPTNWPVLIHCRAGLHRTGIMAALYRLEYQRWSLQDALDELKENGFGRGQCTCRNDYIMQYLLAYKPRRYVWGNGAETTLPGGQLICVPAKHIVGFGDSSRIDDLIGRSWYLVR